MTVLEFFHEHWFLGFFALCFTYGIARAVLWLLPNRILRTIKVCVRGWPPSHLDADGDFKS